jgi:Enoyl-(Acyl carrier protein) reductase
VAGGGVRVVASDGLGIGLLWPAASIAAGSPPAAVWRAVVPSTVSMDGAPAVGCKAAANRTGGRCAREVRARTRLAESAETLGAADAADATGAMVVGGWFDGSSTASGSVEGEVAIDLAPSKLRVNVVSPGPVTTPGSREFSDPMGAPPDLFAKEIPLGRYGSPDDVAEVVVLLASDRGKWITGGIINVDGGMSAR